MPSQQNLTSMKEQIKVVVPEDVLYKIKYLCQIIPKVEWSGILLYDVLGSITDIKNFKIILKDIIPMDKGNSTYTEFNFNEKKRDQSGYIDRHIDYCDEVEEAMSWKLGIIHSHNTMGVFFSATDISELIENAPKHNFYLSFIVNNKMDFMAKVAILGDTSSKITSEYIGLNEFGEEFVINVAESEYKNKRIFSYDCDIHVEGNKNSPIHIPIFERTLFEVIENSTPRHSVSYSTSTQYKGYNTNNTYVDSKTNKISGKTITNKTKSFKNFINYNVSEDDFSDEAILVTKGLLNGGLPKEEVTIISLLDSIEAFKVSGRELASSVLTVLNPVFSEVLDLYSVEDFSDEAYIDLLSEVIEILESFEDDYAFLTKTIEALLMLSSKLNF